MSDLFNKSIGQSFQTHHEKENEQMTRITVSRRNLLATGACALVGAVSLPGLASARALEGQNLTNEEIIRKWYAAWEKKDLGTFDSLLATTSLFRALPATTTSARVLLKRNAGIHRVVSSNILTWSGSPLARTMLL
jgi:hypothetical protein